MSKMTASQIGFNGRIQIQAGRFFKVLTIIFARSVKDDKGPDVWSTSCNSNVNGKVKNTFIWWEKSEDPQLFYRNNEGRLFRVNFEPLNEERYE